MNSKGRQQQQPDLAAPLRQLVSLPSAYDEGEPFRPALRLDVHATVVDMLNEALEIAEWQPVTLQPSRVAWCPGAPLGHSSSEEASSFTLHASANLIDATSNEASGKSEPNGASPGPPQA